LIAINESQLKNSLDSGSTKRLISFRKRLASDDHRRIFDYDVAEVIKRYALKPESIDEEIDYLYNLEENRNGVIIPFSRSYKSYDMMKETWESFMLPEKAPFTWNEHFQEAFQRVCERYPHKLNALKYQSDDDIKDAVTDLSTSSGWTGVVTGKMHKSDVISGSYRTLNAKIEEALANGSFNCPVLPAVRTQCSGEYDESGVRTYKCKHKTRPVWMTDAFQFFAERMFSKPLTEWLKSYDFSAVGKDDSFISKWVHSRQIDGWSYISLDYSKYDSTIPSWLAMKAFEVIERSFQLDDYERRLLNVLCNDFISKNLITANGVLHISHGDPSGSGFTTIVNGICNELITETWGSYLGINNLKYLIMGDDNLIYSQNKIDGEIVASYIKHNFGIIVNLDKTTHGDRYSSPQFLSRLWTTNGPYRNPNILLSMLIYPERPREYEKIKELVPELIIYSYILAYEAGMRELIDIERFRKDNYPKLKSIKWSQVLLREFPYNLRTVIENGEIPIAISDEKLHQRYS